MKNITITFNLVKLTQIEKETALLPPCGETIQAKCNKLHRIFCPIPVCDVSLKNSELIIFLKDQSCSEDQILS